MSTRLNLTQINKELTKEEKDKLKKELQKRQDNNKKDVLK